MRRIIIIGTALAVLAGAAVAYAAAFNTYTAQLTWSPSKAGSPTAPSAVKFEQVYKASGTNGNRAGPLTDIKTTMYGVVGDGKDFPKCTSAQITANHTLWDKACPAGSMVAQGPVNALLGPASSGSSPGSPCNPYLHVYNGGQGVLWYFFVIIPPKYTCATLTTGASAPYKATVKEVGKNLVSDVPLPPDVSTEAGGLKGVYGSLIKEDLTWAKLTRKVGGKTKFYQASVACKSGKRPWSVAFTATSFSGQSETDTVKGSSSC